jgi:D-alanyl-D-alanine carboxypeptidase
MTSARRTGAAALLALTLAACSGEGDAVNHDGAPLHAEQVPTKTTSPGDLPPPFPADAFADLSAEPVDADTAALLQRTLDDAAGNDGATATVMTSDGNWTGATGTADGVRRMRPEAQMAIGSITKTIVAAQVMQLVEAGRFDLDDPAADHLPKKVDFDTNGATVGDLLAMRSGIPDYVDALYRSLSTDTRHVWTADEMLALVPSRRTPAGSEFSYSSTNYLLLGLILEHATGRPLAQILRGGVLDGPGLARLVYQPAERPTAPMAAPGGAQALSRGQGGDYLPSLAGATAAGPAGGMASDSSTLARWWGRLCGGEILSGASFESMIDFERNPEYALGIQDRSYDGPAAVGNEGVHVGFVSLAECLPDLGAVVVVLMNDEEADSASVANALIGAIRSR